MFHILIFLIFLSECWGTPHNSVANTASNMPSIGVDLTRQYLDNDWQRSHPGYVSVGNQMIGARAYANQHGGTNNGGYNAGAGVSFNGIGLGGMVAGGMTKSKSHLDMSAVSLGASVSLGSK